MRTRRLWTGLGASLITALAGCTAAGGAGPARAVASAAPVSPAPLVITGVTPTPGGALPPDGAITVSFSAPLAAHASPPTLSPATPGSWARQGDTFTFTPSQPYAPDVKETLTVPAGTADAAGATLATPDTATFTGAKPSVLRVQQILAHLGYLPLTSSAPTPSGMPAELAAAYTPPAGAFGWRYPSTPGSLQSTWAPGQYTVLTKGAVMAFQRAQGLPVDGVLGPQTWHALLAADQAHATDPHPYAYVLADLGSPERLQVWSDGRIVTSSLVNSGVPGALTQAGIFPVFERFTSTTMTGTDPNGTHYSDPGVPWVSYFNGGDAVHGFVRPGYGYEQSNGCLELPVATANTVFHEIGYGTLVDVFGPQAGPPAAG